jgi:glycosyltransferase involved in cell wall biosynthesis
MSASLFPFTDAAPRRGPNALAGALAGRRIGFVTTVVGFGGSEVLVADAIEAAVTASAEVVCYCHPSAAIRTILKQRNLQLPKITFYDWPPAFPADPQAAHRSLKGIYRRRMPLALKRYFGFLADARRFHRELVRRSLDVLFVNVNGFEAAAVAAGRWSRSRTIACYHLLWTEPDGFWLDRVADRIMRRRSMHAAGCVLHVSAAARDQWCRAVGPPAARTRVIYSGVEDRHVGDRQNVRESLGISPQTFAFCAPSRLDRVKGHEYLLEAVARFAAQLRDCAVLLCGDGKLADELKRRTSELGIDNVVRFLGFRSDLPEVLAAADCSVLPSISENLSIAVLESLTAGTPAIVTNVGAMPEAVMDGVNGLVVPPADADSLGRAMVAMATERDWVRQMRSVARADALARFSKTRMMDEYVSLFSHVISSANA